MRSFVVPSVVALAVFAAACSSSSSNDQSDSAGVGQDSGLDAASEADTAPPNDSGGFSDTLSGSSLYKDWSSKTIADDSVLFQPAYQLWADGLKKRRWIQLPAAGAQIDTSDMDNWKFPVGTKFWKEFSVDGGKILETRLIERTGTKAADYRMGAYIWNDAQTEATWSETGDTNVLGTDHDVPDVAKCQACHNAAPGRINGFQAIQMSKPDGTGVDQVNLSWLITNGWLSNPPSVTHFDIPGDDKARAALGYLHANCGHCHNPNWEFFALTNQVLRLTTDSLDTVEHTNTYRTTYFQHTTSFKDVPWRLDPATSDQSCIYVRPTNRGNAAQMPPIATKHVDDTGVATIKAWIDSLPAAPPPDAGVDGGDAGSDAGPPDATPTD
jgi:hypothetical protein